MHEEPFPVFHSYEDVRYHKDAQCMNYFAIVLVFVGNMSCGVVLSLVSGKRDGGLYSG